MSTQAAQGKKALEAGDYQTAIKQYTAAIKESPTSPEYFVQRSTAYQRNKQYDLALADAEQAVVNAHSRSKREAIVNAQFRRGITLYQLGRFGDAFFCLNKVTDMDAKYKTLDVWMRKTTMALEKLPENDERSKCTITEIPNPTANSTPLSTATRATSITTVTAPSSVAAPQQTPANKIRYEWYQNTENVYFTLLAKGVPKDEAQIEISERSLSISFPTLTGSSYNLTLDPLFAPIVPENCITRIMPSKTEIVLIKATPGQKWSALESNDPIPQKPTASNDNPSTNPPNPSIPPKETAPAYPTSSRHGPKDWDKLAKDMRLGEPDAEGNTAVEDDDDYEGGDEANHFFKKLFKGADPDAQRAMMKSYTESNGTSLSTNWEEVRKGTVETLPPDGMQAKSWS